MPKYHDVGYLMDIVLPYASEVFQAYSEEILLFLSKQPISNDVTTFDGIINSHSNLPLARVLGYYMRSAISYLVHVKKYKIDEALFLATFSCMDIEWREAGIVDESVPKPIQIMLFKDWIKSGQSGAAKLFMTAIQMYGVPFTYANLYDVGQIWFSEEYPNIFVDAPVRPKHIQHSLETHSVLKILNSNVHIDDLPPEGKRLVKYVMANTNLIMSVLSS